MNEIKILDRGYARLVESWGSDERIIEAARMSTNKGFQGWGDPVTCEACEGTGRANQAWRDTGEACESCSGRGKVTKTGDEKLLRFLWENKHHTPFEMAGMTIEVKAPIFVFREWHRHRTQSYNEMSARYAPLPDENYVPTVGRILTGVKIATIVAPAFGRSAITESDALEWLDALSNIYEHIQRVYEMGIRLGIPKELARLPVPVARYSRMRASANLRNWLGFLALRMAPNAQWEIRQYANAVGEFIRELFPRTWALFDER